jgi:hypothetical protein
MDTTSTQDQRPFTDQATDLIPVAREKGLTQAADYLAWVIDRDPLRTTAAPVPSQGELAALDRVAVRLGMYDVSDLLRHTFARR